MNSQWFDVCQNLGAWEIYRPASTHVQTLIGNATGTGAWIGGASQQGSLSDHAPSYGGQGATGGSELVNGIMDGSNDYIDLDQDNFSAVTEYASLGMTVCCAVKTDQSGSAYWGLPGMSNKTNGGGFRWKASDGTYNIQARDSGNTKYMDAKCTNTTLNNGQTHTVVATSNNASGTPVATVYVDGVSQTISYTTQAERVGFLAGSFSWQIGANGVANNKFPGKMSHVAVWAKVLTEAEAQQVHRAIMGGRRISRVSSGSRPMGRRQVPRLDG